MTIYLYVKQHSVTGLKYFGMTRNKNPLKYKGSGKYWNLHLKQHGNMVETLNLWSFDDETQCSCFALAFSKENNIVDSNEWANLVLEDGKYGGHVGPNGKTTSSETKSKISASSKLLNRKVSDRHKKILSETHKNKIVSEETRKKLSVQNTGKTWSDAKKAEYSKLRQGGTLSRKSYECPHCGKIGKGPNMKRYHFDNCAS